MTVKEPNWHTKHNGEMLRIEASLQKEWAALPVDLKVVVFLLAVLGVVVGAEWHNRYRIDAWYHAHQRPVIVAAVLVALVAAYPVVLLVRRHWRHQKVERHLDRIKQLQQSQARIDSGLGFAGSTMTNRLLERERQKLAKRLNQTPPPKDEEPEEKLAQLPDVIPWERPKVHSCMDPAVVGGYGRDVPMRICLTPAPGQQLNMLVAGMSGYGKTTLINLLIANYAYCRDAVMAGIDVMGGGFHRWRRLFVDGWYADKDEDVKPVLDRINEEIERRARHLKAKQDRDEEPIWDPRVDGPDVFVFVDEGADLVGIPDAYDVLFQVARKGRKYGVHVIFATQRPSADVIPTTLRSQLQVRVSLRVMVSTDAEVIFGPGSVSAGWRPHEIPRDGRGIAVLEVPTSDVTQDPGRTIRMLSDQVRLVVEDRAGQQPPLGSKPPTPPPTEAPPSRKSGESIPCKVCGEPFPDLEAVTNHWRRPTPRRRYMPPPHPRLPPRASPTSNSSPGLARGRGSSFGSARSGRARRSARTGAAPPSPATTTRTIGTTATRPISRGSAAPATTRPTSSAARRRDPMAGPRRRLRRRWSSTRRALHGSRSRSITGSPNEPPTSGAAGRFLDTPESRLASKSRPSAVSNPFLASKQAESNLKSLKRADGFTHGDKERI